MRPIFGSILVAASAFCAAQQPPPLLAVHAEIVRQEFCRVDADFFSVRLSVRLRFINQGNETVIFPRRLEDPLTIRGARDAAAIERSDFEFNPSFQVFRPTLAKHKRGKILPPEDNKFVLLAPGKSYDTLVQDSFSAARQSTPGFLTAGDHALQFGVSLWPLKYRALDPDAAAVAWKRYGRLESGTVFSGAVAFTIPAGAGADSCVKP